MLIDTSVQAINIILPTTKSNGHKKKKRLEHFVVKKLELLASD